MSLRTGGRRPTLAPRVRLTAAPDEIFTRAPLLQAFDQMRPGDIAVDGPWLGAAYHAREPLPTKPPVHPQRDFTGFRFDRLTVIGLVDETARKGDPRWLVRCDCGIYETRKAKALGGRMRADRARCRECDYLLHIVRRAHFDRTGRWPADERTFANVQAPISDRPPPPAPPDPNDKGHKGKGDRTAQRRRAKARRRAAEAATWSGRR